MRRFLTDITAFLALQFLVVGAIVAGGWTSFDSFILSHVDRMATARAEPRPKLLVVGDSSAAFGLSAEELARNTGRPAVNLAVHAGLDVALPLRECALVAKDGDIVLISFSWTLLQNPRGWSDPVELTSLATRAPQVLGSFSAENWKRCLDGGHATLGRMMYWGMHAWWRRLHGSRVEAAPPYARASVSPAGDIVGHCDLPRPAVRQHPFPAEWSDIQDLRLAELRRFAEALEARGVIVLWTCPPVVAGQWPSIKDCITRWYTELATVPGLGLIDAPEDARFTLDQFFDTAEHLRCDDRDRHSRDVAARINALLH